MSNVSAGGSGPEFRGSAAAGADTAESSPGSPNNTRLSGQQRKRRDRRPRAHAAGLGYHLIRAIALAVRALLTRARVSGSEYLPAAGGVLIVSNHSSIADPVILIASSPRPLTFMAKEEIWRSWFSRLILNWWGGAFPVRRGQTDIAAVRDALEHLRNGAAVVVFPEGTRRPGGLGSPHPGVSYIATRSGSPVVPVAIIGSEGFGNIWSLRHGLHIDVRIGEAFTVTGEGGDAAQIADEIMLRVSALLPPGRRGIYGRGREDAEVG